MKNRNPNQEIAIVRFRRMLREACPSDMMSIYQQAQRHSPVDMETAREIMEYVGLDWTIFRQGGK